MGNVNMTNSNIQVVDYKMHLETAMKSMEAIVSDAGTLNDRLIELNQKEQDVDHIIENLNFNASQGYALAKKIQEIRRERREIKDRIEQIKEMESMINLYTKMVRPEVEKSIKKVTRFQEVAPKRTYRLRRLTELQPYNDLANKQRGITMYAK